MFGKFITLFNIGRKLAQSDALNVISNISWQDISAIPEKAVGMINDLASGFASLIADPVNNAEAFIEMAGAYVEYGTVAPEIHNINLNGSQYNAVTDARTGDIRLKKYGHSN